MTFPFHLHSLRPLAGLPPFAVILPAKACSPDPLQAPGLRPSKTRRGHRQRHHETCAITVTHRMLVALASWSPHVRCPSAYHAYST